MSVGVVRETVLSTLREALEDARASGDLKLTTVPALVLDVPKKAALGDLATTVAMNLSATEHRDPREIAEIIAGRLRSHSEVLERIEVAPPGYINLTVKRDLWFRVLAEIEAQGEQYGGSSLGLGQRVLLEFVSADPTGPLHMGHGRGAAVGGALANSLRRVGYADSTDDYINETGRAWAYAGMLEDIKADLDQFGLRFDTWVHERALFETGAVAESLELLKARGHLFEQDGALWFRSTTFGDDKDRVIRKQDGEYTYLASDIAYHRDKLDRGYDLLIYIWGAVHNGYITRLQAEWGALGL